jgi:hypothetical protein
MGHTAPYKPSDTALNRRIERRDRFGGVSSLSALPGESLIVVANGIFFVCG